MHYEQMNRSITKNFGVTAFLPPYTFKSLYVQSSAAIIRTFGAAPTAASTTRNDLGAAYAAAAPMPALAKNCRLRIILTHLHRRYPSGHPATATG